LNQGGKLENLKKELQKNAVSVLGVSEVRWKGEGEIRSVIIQCIIAGVTAERGVAIVVHKSVVKSVVKKSVYSDRIIAVKLKAEPLSILIVQVYMPTLEYEDDKVEELCDIIEEILEEDGKGATNTIIMGDWNSVVGDKAHHTTVGTYGLGRRNQRGQMLIDFCERNGLANTWFKKPKRRLYTWKSPGDKSRYQLDYALVKQ
jgi:exonuclease III